MTEGTGEGRMSEDPRAGRGPEQPQSGLRNPGAAVRGVGAAALAAEGLVLLLAIVPLRVLGATGTGGTLVVLTLAVASFALAGLLRRGWAWIAGSVFQVVLIGGGFVVHSSLVVIGVLFGLVWVYVLRVRRSVLGHQRR
jgi:hypothetical protein